MSTRRLTAMMFLPLLTVGYAAVCFQAHGLQSTWVKRPQWIIETLAHMRRCLLA